jgi:hypothetical protein
MNEDKNSNGDINMSVMKDPLDTMEFTNAPSN